jgi:hypothetical protein
MVYYVISQKKAKENIVNWKPIISLEKINENFRRLQHFCLAQNVITKQDFLMVDA